MEGLERLVWALILLLLLTFLGLAVIFALLSAWRNQSRRQRLLDQGKQMRRAYRGGRAEPTDAWNEAGKRYRADTDADNDDDNPDDGRDDDANPSSER